MPYPYIVREIDIALTKHCTKCNTTKSKSQFHRSKANPTGLYVWCKSCRHAYNVSPPVKAANAISVAKYYAANYEKTLAANRKYRAKWIAANPTRARIYGVCSAQARRARLRGVVNDLTEPQWREVLQVFNNACAYCQIEGVPLEQDHIQPIRAGGAHTINNVAPACFACNRRKAGRSLLAFTALQHGVPFLKVLPAVAA